MVFGKQNCRKRGSGLGPNSKLKVKLQGSPSFPLGSIAEGFSKWCHLLVTALSIWTLGGHKIQTITEWPGLQQSWMAGRKVARFAVPNLTLQSPLVNNLILYQKAHLLQLMNWFWQVVITRVLGQHGGSLLVSFSLWVLTTYNGMNHYYIVIQSSLNALQISNAPCLGVVPVCPLATTHHFTISAAGDLIFGDIIQPFL